MNRRTLLLGGFAASLARSSSFIKQDLFQQHVSRFNQRDAEDDSHFIRNGDCAEWMRANVPAFECPDQTVEEIYYFRWWTYRKHIRKTPRGFVVTEFLPDVPWAGKYNTISCAAGHHFYEGRWIRNREYLDDYGRFWFSPDGEPRRYSFWVADVIHARYLVHGDQQPAVELLPALIANYREWEKDHRDPNRLFWQIDDRDGMEYSLGGSGYRPTINSYLYGDAKAIASLASLANNDDTRKAFEKESGLQRQLFEQELWDDDARFYKTKPRGGGALPVSVREEIGYVPWYFLLPRPGREMAWGQLFDSQGFYGRFGPTSAERRSRGYFVAHNHECLWNGPSWPFATTQTLVALANLLNHYEQRFVSKTNYFDLLRTYARSQHKRQPDGSVVPWIDENLHPDTGEWIARDILHRLKRPDQNRGKDYNHSAFGDLVITGLAGLRPRPDSTLEVNPLIPNGRWPYFCLENIHYHGRTLAVIWDADGSRYGRGAGLQLFADGRRLAQSVRLDRIEADLNL
jgi:hypothetical protein